MTEEQDDIESNLLVPAGVSMRSATLSLKVYRAEDVPQSEPSLHPDLSILFQQKPCIFPFKDFGVLSNINVVLLHRHCNSVQREGSRGSVFTLYPLCSYC